MNDPAEEGQVLLGKWLIKTQLVPEGRDCSGRGFKAEEGAGGVPGHEMDQQEDDESDTENHRNQLCESPRDEYQPRHFVTG
jgi:hypothetical protein